MGISHTISIALLALCLAGCAGPRTGTSPAQAGTSAATADAEVQALARRASDPLCRDVVLLRSSDFVERAQAAGRLVEAGGRALPALGEAGEALVTEPGGQEVSTTKPVLGAIMEDLPLPAIEAGLEARWSVVRRAAAAELGRRRGWTPVPALVARLDDPDERVRAEAASSLRRLTNRFFGYDARADLRVRSQAARRWREWWTIEGRVRAEQGRLPGEG